MSEPTGIRGSSLTGVAASATIVLDGGVGVVPGGVVMAGTADVYYLAVCRECGEMVFPFDSVARRDSFTGQHPHTVALGIEIRNR
jgi:hypothetical protein